MPMEAILQIRIDIGHYIQQLICIICLYILIYTFRNEDVIIVTTYLFCDKDLFQ